MAPVDKFIFLPESRDALNAITGSFDFVWPTAAAMWNLRWQVQGYVQAVPTATVEDLFGRFVAGSGIHGANLKRSCLEQTWEEQQERFAAFLLTALFGYYEHWESQVVDKLSLESFGMSPKSLQFPSHTHKGRPAGIGVLFSTIAANKSIPLEGFLYPELAQHRLNSIARIEGHLKCYRYFKELRNCLVHGNGAANAKLKGAYDEFLPVASTTALGLPEVPVHYLPVVNSKTTISLRGVVGFSNIVQRIIVTLDAEISKFVKSEDVFVDVWKAQFGALPISLRSQNRSGDIDRSLRRLFTELGFPLPKNLALAKSFCKSHGLCT